MTDRLPPFSEENERGALGCLLLAPDCAKEMLAKLRKTDFHDLRHQEIFTACVCLHADGKPTESFLVVQWLKDKARLEAAGGAAYVSELPGASPSAVAFDYFLEILKDKAQRRVILEASARLSALAHDEAIDPKALVHDAKICFDHALLINTEKREWLRFYKPSECRAFDPPVGLVLVGDCHIARGTVTVIAGPPGVGKSRGGNGLAVSGATGKDWFGLKVHRQFKTAVLQNENGLHRLKMEFTEIGMDGLDEFVRVSEPPAFGMAFDHMEFRTALAGWLAEWKPDVVVFDPWNSAARDDGQRDYLALFQALKDVLPKGDTAPALVIVAHTRKPRGDERKTGRGLLNDVAGSHVLVSVPRCVFVMQHASDDPEDDRVVWTCCKNNDGEPGGRTAWHRRNGLFIRCENFDWDAFDKPEGDRPRKITKSDLEKLFEGGRRQLEKKHAEKELEELTGLGRSACYDALKLDGRFGEHLREGRDGLLSWNA